MATSIRYDIIHEIKSILEDITIVNGFLTNVAFVSDKLKIDHPEELDNDKFPACFILDETETKEALTIFSDTGDDMSSLFTVSITSIIFDREGDTILARTNLMQDVEKAIVGDAGLLALLIEPAAPTTVETDQGYFGNYSVFKQSFDCQYIYAHANGGA
jgi:CRISPR/Cas system CMR-associated protein Cmr5 small subunit